MLKQRAIRFSIRAKVLLLALGLALPPLLIVGALGLTSLDRARDSAIQVGTAALRSQAETNLAKRATDKARLYDTTLAHVQQQVESVAAFSATMIDNGPPQSVAPEPVWIAPDGPLPANLRTHAAAVARARQFVPLLRSLVQHDRLVSLGYVALEDGGVLATDHDIVATLDAIKPFDPRVRSWYVAARNAGRTVWVDTYIDANTKQLTTTCATPIYDADENFVGVVGFDILLGTIQQDLLNPDLSTDGYAFLLNERGDVLVRPDMRAEGRKWNEPFGAENLLHDSDPALRDVVQQMVDREQGTANLMYQGGNVYLAYAPIPSAGWSVGIVVPESEVIRP
ncbi:MAG TPA: cache domain-containing protein, partial [Roseiflexaceae bacterium]|nr:cache domain-containing protein [Roseiflexaceae bacterium]